VLFNLRLLPGNLPRDARAYGELTGELHHAVIGFLAMTPSQLLVVNQEDLTKETAQQNLPGATWQYPNWGRKMRYSLEELRSDETARNFGVMVRDWIAQSGRRNQTGHTAESSY
jgi:4-alpha-glucanotransferase